MLTPEEISQDNIIILVHKVGVGLEDKNQISERFAKYNQTLHQENRVFDNLFIKHYLLPSREVPYGEVNVECVYPNRKTDTLPEEILKIIKESIDFMNGNSSAD